MSNDHRKSFDSIIDEISKRTGIKVPISIFRYGFTDCWKCEEPILVFSWPNKDASDLDSDSFKNKPDSIKFVFSKTKGTEYWANTCPFCEALQGDFFLYNEPDGPFFHLSCGTDDPESFKNDIQEIADYQDYQGQIELYLNKSKETSESTT